MSDESLSPPAAPVTPGPSMLFRLCEEVIALRETNGRQHKLFEQALARARDELNRGFGTFAQETQRAYQQLRQELHGEKRTSLALLNELLEMTQDLERISASRPPAGDANALERWAESVAVQTRKAQAALARHGVVPYEALPGQPYNPALHERVGSRAAEGMGPMLVAEQREGGYASQQPEFVLRRPKVVITE